MNVTPPRTPGAAQPTVPSARTAPPTEGGTEPAPASRGFLAKAALITAALSVAGALLGLARDQALARLFGAGSETDAFLVAWTVPEFAATLLIEDGLALVLIPAFSLALSRRARGAPGDPVRALVATTLPRLSLALITSGGLVVVGAPFLVGALAPGLTDPGLAVDCTRLTATCVVTFGLAGYCSAALRAHRRFLAPAAIYVAYNTGIITTMLVLSGRWGVRSAALGVAVGGCLMVALQLPSLWRQLRGRSAGGPAEEDGEAQRRMGLALVCAVLLFSLCRQSQVLIERFLASHLDAGAISHLNYAQKVAQIPMTLSLMLVTVTFPVVARALADGDGERARDRVERDLALAACIVLLGAATVVACGPQMIELLFQRGAFTARDTAATAEVMRVYALGLLGQTLVGALVRTYFSDGRPSWYPLAAMAAGVAATGGIGACTVGLWGVSGIAAANAAGITLTAGMLLGGARARRGRRAPNGDTPPDAPTAPDAPTPTDAATSSTSPAPTARTVVPLRLRHVLADLGRPIVAAAGATVAGAFAASRFEAPLPGLLLGCLTVAVVFVLLGRALGEQGVVSALRSVRSVTRRLAHARSR
ncbi:lipid II flippase MurJ [Streptomyces sp. NPDC089424]|uniref:lipid II flippase MurJ n=1 Tax=Streptomyces sp. NPDC089424 TaxID=3365917 RepID=UPI00380152DC